MRANDAQTPLTSSIAVNPAALKPSPKFLNGEVHHWYRLVLGYPDHLVAALLERIQVTKQSRVLDPFCGSGTTLVECMKRGVRAVGLDANPASVLATEAKTDWTLDPDRFRRHAEIVRVAARNTFRRGTDLTDDPTYRYLESSGMLKRGWISDEPLRQALAIKRHLRRSTATKRYKRLLQLCLVSEVVYGASNVKFGPEIYCGPQKTSHDVFAGFDARVAQAAEDLEKVRDISTPQATVLHGDARECDRPLKRLRPFTACVCSPPYPTEHDYTRNTRLELAFLEAVGDLESLRTIKKTMIRSHSKGIYVGDSDGLYATRYAQIRTLVQVLQKEVGEARGFVGLYPEVIRHYFGGMRRHFIALKKVLAQGARCAYVVGDQSSYCGVHVPTAEILSDIVKSLGFVDIEVVHWRGRWSTTRSQEVDENILLFSVPQEGWKTCHQS